MPNRKHTSTILSYPLAGGFTGWYLCVTLFGSASSPPCSGALHKTVATCGALYPKGAKPMPLTPLPEDTTKRYWVIYTYGPYTHKFQIRASNTLSDSTALSDLQFDFNILKTSMAGNVDFIALEVAAAGSNVRNPVPGWSTITGTTAADTDPQHYVRSFSIRGRSTTGRKTKNLLFGVQLVEQADFEASPPVGGLSTFITQMQARTTLFLAIDGSKPSYRTNVLEDYNDHWQKEARP